MDLYDFVVKDAYQFNVNLSDYKGKVLMIVNTATGCGFTPQYSGLQELRSTRNRGLNSWIFRATSS